MDIGDVIVQEHVLEVQSEPALTMDVASKKQAGVTVISIGKALKTAPHAALAGTVENVSFLLAYSEDHLALYK